MAADYSELASAVRASAKRLGVDPADILTAMSYETGGKLDPNIMGGAGKRYMGLIQFGPEEQAKYGVKPGMAIGDQVTAAENFLRDRGVKPGMGLLDIYSTINAGRPGLYNRSDAANGGAPGTVADKVATMMGHRLRANRILGIQGDAPPAQAAAPQAAGGAPAAASAPLSLAPSTGGGAPSPAPDAGLANAIAALAAVPAGVAQDQGPTAASLPPIRYVNTPGVARALAMAMFRNQG